MTQFEGTLIAGRYEIREHIATGGMASVFKTWDHRVERLVAIKVLRSLDKNDLRSVERFRREARAAAVDVADDLVLRVEDRRGNDGLDALQAL